MLVVVTGVPLLVLASWTRSAAAPDASWAAFVRRTAGQHALLAVLLAAFGLQIADAHGVTTDGVIYFSQLRSAVFDRDLDVAAEFAFLGQPPRPSHVVPIGPTLVWLPLYLIVAGIDAVGRAFSWWRAPAEAAGIGLTAPYVRAALVSSFLVGAIGLFVIHRRLQEEFSAASALAGTLIVFLATPLVWYMVYEPSMTHAASFGLVALFVVYAERYTAIDIPPRRALLLGLLLGLAFMTRPQEAVFALFPATLLLLIGVPFAVRARAALRFAAWGLAGAAPCLLAQALHSIVLFRREAFALSGEGGYLNLLGSRWMDTLWSSWHGFFSWTPVAYLAFVATFFYAARNRRWAIAAIAIVGVMAWVNGATADWAGGWSFGGRRFISVLVVLAPAFALMVEGLLRRPVVALSLVAVAFIAWNQLLIAQYSRGVLTQETPVSFGQIVRQQAAMATRSPFLYPFAFPANAWFAWRTGLPMDRYDLLGSESFASSFDLSMSATTGRYLIDGWEPRTSDAFGDLRWVDGLRAEALIPFDPMEAPLTIEVQARTRLLDPPQSATLALLINDREVGEITPGMEEASTTVLTVPNGSRVLKRGFNRVVLERRAGSAPVAIYRIRLVG